MTRRLVAPMQVTTPFLAPGRVLIVRNSNAAWSTLSSGVADWYASARGLGAGYYWLSFDFGDGTSNLITKLCADYLGIANPYYGNASWTTGNGNPNIVLDHASTPLTCSGQSSNITASQVGASFLASLAHVIDTYAIDVVLVTPGVPERVLGPFNGGSGIYFGQPTEIVCSLGQRFNAVAFGDRRGDTQGVRQASICQGALTLSGTASGASRRDPLSRQLANDKPMQGRIGWAEGVSFSSLAQVQTIVNNALAAEAENNLVKPHVIGGTAYIYGGGTRQSTAANFAARDLGVIGLGYISTPSDYGTVTLSTAELGYWNAKPAWSGSALAELWSPDAFYSSQGVQAPGGGQLSAFAVASPRLAPIVGDSRYSDRLAFQAGGWAYSWLSDAQLLARFCLQNGGSLAFTVTGEPTSGGMADQDSLVAMLLQGRPACEAIYRALGSTTAGASPGYGWNVLSAWGDPLYAPYRLTRLV